LKKKKDGSFEQQAVEGMRKSASQISLILYLTLTI
jgi:hypothetical protein